MHGVRIGFKTRAAAGKDRERGVVFVDGRPIVDFCGADDYDKSGILASTEYRKWLGGCDEVYDMMGQGTVTADRPSLPHITTILARSCATPSMAVSGANSAPSPAIPVFLLVGVLTRSSAKSTLPPFPRVNRAFRAMATIYLSSTYEDGKSIEPYSLLQSVCLFDIEVLKEYRAHVIRAPTANKSIGMHDPI